MYLFQAFILGGYHVRIADVRQRVEGKSGGGTEILIYLAISYLAMSALALLFAVSAVPHNCLIWYHRCNICTRDAVGDSFSCTHLPCPNNSTSIFASRCLMFDFLAGMWLFYPLHASHSHKLLMVLVGRCRCSFGFVCVLRDPANMHPVVRWLQHVRPGSLRSALRLYAKLLQTR